MKRRMIGATFGCLAALAAATGAVPVLAQDKPTLRVWSGAQPPANWVDPRAEGLYVSRAPADAAETRRIERLMDRVFDAYPSSNRLMTILGAPGAQFQPTQPSSRPSYGILLRLEGGGPTAFGGYCGQSGVSRYLTAPAEWFDRAENRDWASTYPELSLAMAVGWKQVHGYCDDMPGLTTLTPGQSGGATPASLALNGLGAGLGYFSLWGGRDRAGQDWGYFSGGEMLLRSGVSSFRGDDGMQTWTGVGRRLAGVRRVDQPLFEITAEAFSDVSLWATLGRAREWRFLNAAYSTYPANPNSASSVRDWLDAALIAGSGSDRGLARILAKRNWLALIGDGVIPRRAEGRGVFARDMWQGAMVENGGSGGCLPVDLSLNDSVREVAFTLREAASNCIVVRWSGEKPTPRLPPVFTVVADVGDAGVDALDGLHLTAYQTWQPRSTQGPIQVDILSPADLIRPGMVVEDARSRHAVKTWEVIHNPDPSFADQGMTIALTNLHPDGDSRTRPMTLRLTVGPGAHRARQSVRASVAQRDSDCAVREVSIGAASEALLAQTAFHIAAIDPADFSINGYFTPAGSPDLLARMVECSRVQMAMGTVIGERLGGTRPEGPNAECQGVQTEMTNMGMAAMAAAGSGNVENFAGGTGMPSSSLDFRIEATRPVTGPGRYPARLSGGLNNPRLEQQGLILPSSMSGDGEIVVERATSGAMVVRYQARFEPSSDRCSPRLDGDISGALHMVVALPTTPRDALVLTMARPVEMMGELLWSRLSPAEHAAMNAQSRRAQDDPQPASAAGASAGAPMDLACRMTDAEIAAVLNRILGMIPEAARAEYRAQFRADRETARAMACLYRDAI